MSYRDMPSLVEQIRGISYKPEDVRDHLDDSSITLLRANNIVDGSIELLDVIYVNRKCVSENQILRHGDILICASSGSKNLVGKAAKFMLDGEFTFGAFCKVVRPKDVADGDYISMFFQSPHYRRAISSVAIGANINNIRNEHIDSLKVLWPDFKERKAIEKRLQSIMTVINYRKCQLHALDCLIKARFVEMFGDYRTNSKNFETHPGNELFKFSSGKFLPEEKRLETGIPVYGGNGIFWYTDKSLIDYPTVVIGRVGAWCGNIHAVYEPVWITDNAIYIKENKAGKHTLEFLTELMRVMNFHQYADFSGQPKITQKPLETLNYLTPPVELQNEFTNFVSQVDKSKVVVQKALLRRKMLVMIGYQEYFVCVWLQGCHWIIWKSSFMMLPPRKTRQFRRGNAVKSWVLSLISFT